MKGLSQLHSRLIFAVVLIAVATYTTLATNNHGELPESLIPSNASFAFWAFLLGGISAVSLVLGSILGIIWQPSPKIIAGFTAFGAGALLAALSVELVAPTVEEFVNQKNTQQIDQLTNHSSIEFLSLIVGCILGGLVFYFLNEALNSKGGYLRKVSTTISYFNRQRRNRYRIVLEHLSKIRLFRSIPHSHLDILVHHLKFGHINAGRNLIHQGDIVNRIIIIEKGKVELFENGEYLNTLKEGDLIGVSSFLNHTPSPNDVIAKTEVRIFEISQNDFNLIHESCPELQDIIEKESKHELLHTLNHTNGEHHHKHAKAWAKMASEHLHKTAYVPSQVEINREAKKHNAAPLSIWLGIFLDGIPESFVIGAGFILILSAKTTMGAVGFFDVIPYTLIAGLFLSNFPEAMSSSIGMKKMGWKPLKILTLWISLMLMTAVGAVFGYYYGVRIPNYLEIGVEGMAAGAMLTMIAQTMIPEAVHVGGNRVTGLSTLAGYLSAVAFKIFE